MIVPTATRTGSKHQFGAHPTQIWKGAQGLALRGVSHCKIGRIVRNAYQKFSIIQTLLLLVMPAMASSWPFGEAMA